MSNNKKEKPEFVRGKFFTTREVGEILRMNYRKILDMIKLGTLPAYKIGGQYIISEAELFDFIENHRYKSYWKDKII